MSEHNHSKHDIRQDFKYIVSTRCADRCLSGIVRFEDGRVSNQRVISNLLIAYGGSDMDTFPYWQKLYDHGCKIIETSNYPECESVEMYATLVYTQAKALMVEQPMDRS